MTYPSHLLYQKKRRAQNTQRHIDALLAHANLNHIYYYASSVVYPPTKILYPFNVKE